MMRLRLQMLTPVSAKCSWKQADILKGGRVRRPLEKRGEPLATADVACLRARTELARVHVLDHALAQRADGIGTHRQLLSGMRLTTPRSSRQDARPAIGHLHPGCRADRHGPRLSGLSRSDLVPWHLSDVSPRLQFGRYRGESRHRLGTPKSTRLTQSRHGHRPRNSVRFRAVKRLACLRAALKTAMHRSRRSQSNWQPGAVGRHKIDPKNQCRFGSEATGLRILPPQMGFHATARCHFVVRRRGRRVAACRPRAAASNAGDRISRRPVL